VFYGWWVALAVSVMAFYSTGIRFMVGPFVKPMVADLGLDRASFSLVVSLSLFLYGAFMPFVGTLADRYGVRPVTAIGAVVLAGALAGTGLVTTLWQLYLVYGVLVGLGLALTGHVVASAVVARWFVRRRATALSLLSGISIGGMSLLVPVVMWLILSTGWRASYAIIGASVFALVLPLSLFVVRESPEDIGLVPDGGPAPPAAVAVRPAEERTDLQAALRSLPFWQLAGGLLTCGFSMALLSSHGVPMLTDHGYTPMLASWALGLLGGTSVVFVFLLGVVADRWGSRPVLAWIYFGRAFCFLALFLIRDHPLTILGVAALGGMTMGGTFALGSALTADIYGRYSVGTVFGSIFLVHQVGAALGSWVGGALFEATGGYGLPFGLAAAGLVVGSIVVLLLDVRPRCAPRLQPVAGGRRAEGRA
jgi:MFS family permease